MRLYEQSKTVLSSASHKLQIINDVALNRIMSLDLKRALFFYWKTPQIAGGELPFKGNLVLNVVSIRKLIKKTLTYAGPRCGISVLVLRRIGNITSSTWQNKLAAEGAAVKLKTCA